MAFEKNLEALIREDGEILAWMYDPPEDMRSMVSDDGRLVRA